MSIKKPANFRKLDSEEIEYDGGKLSDGATLAIICGAAAIVAGSVIGGFGYAYRNGAEVTIENGTYFGPDGYSIDPAGIFATKKEALAFTGNSERFNIGKIYSEQGGYAVWRNNTDHLYQ